MSIQIKGNHHDYSMFDNMSTEALEDILRSDSQLPNDENSDMDAILYIMEVIAKREKENPTGKFIAVHTAWASFTESYLPASKDNKSLYDFEEVEPQAVIEQPNLKNFSLHPKRRRLMRVASIAVIFSALLLAGTVTAKALGFDLWNAVAKWTSDTFGFSSSVSETQESQEPGIQTEYKSLQEALDRYGIIAKLAPTWYPDGYAINGITVNETPTQTIFHAQFTNNDGAISINITSLSTPSNRSYEKDGENVTALTVNDTEFYIMTNLDQTRVVWHTENFESSISGKFSSDEAEKIITSIYERK